MYGWDVVGAHSHQPQASQLIIRLQMVDAVGKAALCLQQLSIQDYAAICIDSQVVFWDDMLWSKRLVYCVNASAV